MNKKIAFITPDFPPKNIGGCAISSNLIVKELRKNGIYVDVFCFSYYENQTIKQKNGSNFYFKAYPKIPPLNNLVLLKKLKNKLKKYEVIHVYNMGLIPSVAILKKKKAKNLLQQ